MTAPSDLMLMARVAGSLVVVVLVALLAARLARRVGRRTTGPALHVVERVGLTREAGAVVLQVNGRHLLLGVTAHGVSLLADLGGTAAEPAAEPTAPISAPAWFEPSEAPLEPAPPGTISSLPGQPSPVTAAVTASVTAAAAAAADGITVITPLSRRAIREATGHRRIAVPPTQRGTGSVLDPRTWRQGVEALRDLTARRR